MRLNRGVLCLLWATVALASPVSRQKQKQKLLLISFDGFRWDYDRDVDTPNLDQMAKDGVKAQFVTPPYLTITSPSHFTLLTGLYVENHGVIHNMWFNTSTSQTLPYYQTQFKNEWWDNGSLPIWITAQRQGLKTGSLHFPGTASTYDGETAQVKEVEPMLYNYKNETLWRQNTEKVMSWFRDKDLDFISMYFGEPDGTGHRYGPESPQVREMVKQVDRAVGYLRQTARSYGLEDRLNMIMTADHGMATVYRNGLVEEITLYKIPGFAFKDLDFHILDYGPSGMLLPKPGMLDKVYAALKGAHPHLHVYKKEELPERLHFSKNERILPIILWADPGYVINGYFPVQFNKGEHGFDNEAMDMKAFFRAVGPAFAQGLEVGPFESVNIYPLMCHILGIQPEKNDGNLELTKHMLRDEGGTGNSTGLNILPNVFTGLAAMAGFMVVVFIVFTTSSILKRRRNRSPSVRDDKKKEDNPQTSF
uniref:Ectonucleotide pyrophosphatase/phosphodiesterase 7 n=1 Tax=Neogobius melanostomus TaxID=47308 RepID=A0A8C6UED1_9GOBI